MDWKETVVREFKVAFSLGSQPLWFRFTKWAVLISFIWLFNRYSVFWVIFCLLIVLSLVTHFYYRKKTNGWTKSYGGWHYEKVFYKEK